MVPGHFLECGADCLANIEKVLRDERGDSILAADYRVLKTLGERLGNGATQRRDQVDPIGT